MLETVTEVHNNKQYIISLGSATELTMGNYNQWQESNSIHGRNRKD